MLIWFAETTLVATVLALVAAGVGRLRPIGPTARHLLWLVVLVKLMTPPLFSWPWALHWPDIAPQKTEAVDPPGAGPLEAIDLPSVDRSEPSVCDAEDNRPRTIRIAWPTVAQIPGPDEVPTGQPPNSTPSISLPSWPSLSRRAVIAWLLLSGLLVAGQAWRILRFRRRLALGVPAPDELIDESIDIATQLGTRVPDLLVVPGLGTPMLWCLGRPRILLPAALVKSLDLARWRGILAHELAHLRRGDHWVSRLELIAGWIWWWNPLYWLACSRLDAEAELACDAWVVWALPGQRLAYAETLFAIGSASSRAVAPAPALGAAGSGRLLERRLTMILRESVPSRLSPAAPLAAALLILLALPSWSATSAPPSHPDATALAPAATPTEAAAPVTDDPEDNDADEDDDDDDDDKAAQARRKAEAKARAEARTKVRAEVRAKARTAAKAKAPSTDRKQHKIEVKVEGDLGPEFGKKMEQIGKEIETMLGPGSDFEKKMEQIGKEIEVKLGPGSDFEKKMEQIGKEMEARFGPGSDFETKMKNLGQEMEARFGPGSDFEKKMKDVGAKLGPGSEVNTRIKEKIAEKTRSKDETTSLKQKPEPGETPKAAAKSKRREARIAALEAQVRKLAAELKALESEDDEDR